MWNSITNAGPAEFAYVRYLEDNKKEIVPISYVKNFEPFDTIKKNKKYQVLWKNAKGTLTDDESCADCYYEAELIYVAGTRKQIEEQLEKKRTIFGKKDMIETEEGSSTEETPSHNSSKSSKRKKKSKQSNKSSNVSHLKDIMKAKLAKLNSGHGVQKGNVVTKGSELSDIRNNTDIHKQKFDEKKKTKSTHLNNKQNGEIQEMDTSDLESETGKLYQPTNDIHQGVIEETQDQDIISDIEIDKTIDDKKPGKAADPKCIETREIQDVESTINIDKKKKCDEIRKHKAVNGGSQVKNVEVIQIVNKKNDGMLQDVESAIKIDKKRKCDEIRKHKAVNGGSQVKNVDAIQIVNKKNDGNKNTADIKQKGNREIHGENHSVQDLLKMNNKLKKENKGLKQQNHDLTKMNMELQRDVINNVKDLLHKLNFTDEGPSTNLYPDVGKRAETNTHIGQGVWVPNHQIDSLLASFPTVSHSSKLVMNLACTVFGTEKLRTSSVTGRKCNSKKDSVAKPALDPRGLTAIREFFVKWLKEKKLTQVEIDARASKIPGYINSKIYELNRTAKEPKRSLAVVIEDEDEISSEGGDATVDSEESSESDLSSSPED